MNTTTLCPGVHRLRRYTAGRLNAAERDDVRDHLDGCPWCRSLVEGLEATRKDRPLSGEEGWSETGMSTTATATHFLKSRPTWPREVSTDTDDTDSGLDALDLSFLEPSTRADALGQIADYEVLGLLGRGGMGVVLKAFDESLHRMVAIKVLAPKLAASRRARRQFLHEARSAAAINHPNVVTIHAVNVHKGMPYLVMECIAGQSLRQRIHHGPKLNPTEVLRIGLQIASGLAAAHAQGVIHRDIKPANIMLEDHDRPGQDHRLRPGPGRAEPLRDDLPGADRRHPRLHVAGAGSRRTAGPPQRPV